MERQDISNESLKEKIIEKLKSVYDPEIPVNIYDLGLIYEILVDDDQTVHVTMTLTAPNCPMADDMLADVDQKVRGVEGVKDLDLKLTFDPPWDKSMLTEEAALALGLL
jgi:FeS assembly SUF system protein